MTTDSTRLTDFVSAAREILLGASVVLALVFAYGYWAIRELRGWRRPDWEPRPVPTETADRWMAFATLALVVLISTKFPSEWNAWELTFTGLSLIGLCVLLLVPPFWSGGQEYFGPLDLATVRKYFGTDAVVDALWFVNRWVITSRYGEVVLSNDSLRGVIGEQDCFRRALLMGAEIWGTVIVSGERAFLAACALHASEMGIGIIPEIYDDWTARFIGWAVGTCAAIFSCLFWWGFGPDGRVPSWLAVGACLMLGGVVQLTSFPIIEGLARWSGRREGLVYRSTVPPVYGNQDFFDEDDYQTKTR